MGIVTPYNYKSKRTKKREQRQRQVKRRVKKRLELLRTGKRVF